jgi:MATE family, multidrug efflux pump
MKKGVPTLRSILAIALPMVVSQASETIMLFADRLFLSRIGEAYIAGAMSGGLTFFTVVSLFAATVGYVNAIAAQYYGAGRLDRCAQTAAQGFYASFLLYPLLIPLMPLVRGFFVLVGHTEIQVLLEYTYFRILMYGALLVLIRNVFTGFFLGLGRSRIVMLANMAGMAVNIPANYILIFGAFGVPAMGIRGAAIGTIIGSATIVTVFASVYFGPKIRGLYNTHRSFALIPSLLFRLLRFGLPSGVETFLNVAAFNVFLQLMHSYGTDVAAAVTITLNYDMVAFIPMIGLSFAATAIIGQRVGAKDYEGAVASTSLILKIAYSYAATMMLLFLFATRPLITLFTSGIPNAGETIIPLGIVLLRLASLYTLADATQLVFAGALRGAGDTRFVMKISVALHWLFAAAAFLLIKVLAVTPTLMWIFFITFVLCMGLVMMLRFRGGRWRSIVLIED